MPATNVGVIGLGKMGLVHLDAYRANPDAQVVLAVDCDRARLERAGAIRTSTDITAVADDPEVECVSVCLPHHLHAPVAGRLLAGGKAVVLEKPIAVTAADAGRLLEAAGPDGRSLVVKSYLRHSAPFVAMHDAVRDGAIGEIRIAVGVMSSHRHAPGTAAWRSQQAASGGGVLIDSAIHLIDVVHWCMGVEEEVTAAQRALAGGDIKAGGDIEVDGGVLLRYADGRLAMIGATQAGAAGAGVYYRLELVGTGGRIVVLCQGSRATCLLATPAAELTIAESGDWWAVANTSALAHYVANFRAGRPLGEHPREAAENLATVLAGYRAARTGEPARPHRFLAARQEPAATAP
jgi:UDP-N-acetyl-2-amino-2-deoxyglucuronate dehydrogenase